MQTKETTGRVYQRPESRNLWIEFTGTDGRKIRQSARTSDRKEAEEYLKQVIKRHQSITFQEAVVNFFQIKEEILRPKSIRGYLSSLRALDPYLGNLTLPDITTDVLKGFVAERRQKVGPDAVKADLRFLSSVFSTSIETLPGVDYNPVKDLPKRTLKSTKRRRWLTPSEYQALLDGCTEEMQRLIIKTAVFTGMRSGELLSLRKHNLDFERKEVTLYVESTKSHMDRKIALCAPLCAELEQLCARTPDDLVFCYRHALSGTWRPYSTFANWWKAARRRANLENVRFHDLRHTFASWWAQGGGDTMVLKEALGHSSLNTSAIYTHLDSSVQHEVVNRVFSTVANTVSDTGAEKSTHS